MESAMIIGSIATAGIEWQTFGRRKWWGFTAGMQETVFVRISNLLLKLTILYFILDVGLFYDNGKALCFGDLTFTRALWQ